MNACTTGKPKIPTRAPHSERRVNAHTKTQAASETAKATGESTAIAPTNVSTDRPPRNLANTGQA